jgi:thiol-disulfide isomerase/thioredoxin
MKKLLLIFIFSRFVCLLSAQDCSPLIRSNELPKSTNDRLTTRKPSYKVVNFFKGDFAQAKKIAANDHKLIFIDVYTTWCGPCKILERDAFGDENIAELMNAFFVNLRADAEAGGKDIAREYSVAAYPTTLILDPKGAQVERSIGFNGVNYFKNTIERIVRQTQEGSLYFELKAAYQKHKMDFKYVLLYATMRQKLDMNNQEILASVIKNYPPDSLKKLPYQQFICDHAVEMSGLAFEYMLNNRNVSALFEQALHRLILDNLNMAIADKDENLLKTLLKANVKIYADPIAAEEKNEQYKLKYYRLTDAPKSYHESALTLLSKFYLPRLSSQSDSIIQVTSAKIQQIGLFYAHHNINKADLKAITDLLSRTPTVQMHHELLAIQSQMYYRLGNLEQSKAAIQSALKLSNNAKEYAELSERIMTQTF